MVLVLILLVEFIMVIIIYSGNDYYPVCNETFSIIRYVKCIDLILILVTVLSKQN